MKNLFEKLFKSCRNTETKNTQEKEVKHQKEEKKEPEEHRTDWVSLLQILDII